ncbi:ArsA family ATPase [Streptomyces yaizuensis]|uniref:ArsA family ATPase n=1 Tax=Streptomyces yaizuensis TaxID=2989713 RepID=A0ABQ5NUV4_9ACTN|nr:ArsA-related P-loop ATPase [Streptomyces sp. YSPA8]GLF94141.1 ArsA family ATPase [Streptomyces sp. YSPA8]
MRQVLVTGLGGAGRTTVAAATALAAAGPGRRVLLLGTDPHTLFGTPLTGTPQEVAEGLWAARVDSGDAFRAEFLALQERAGAALDLLGAVPLAAEELTELPGTLQFALLKAVAGAADGGFDLLVLDLPPVRETIELLALPERLRRYLRRLLPPERQAARALRPVLAQLAGVPMPAHWLYETAGRWESDLAAVQELIEAPGTTLTLVAEPGPSAADALRTARTGLALHGLPVGELIANRVLPRHSADTWLAALAAQQEKTLHEWYGEWGAGTAVRELPHLGHDPRDRDDLERLATARTADADRPLDARSTAVPVVDRRDDGTFGWSFALPGADKKDIGLVRRGDELLLRAGPFRRIVPLPSVLRRCTVSGAALTDGTLTVRFTPDPGLWPRPTDESP